MQQLLLPFTSSSNTIYINALISVWQHDDRWTYFLGKYPIYNHGINDKRLLLLTIAQLIEAGACRQIEIINALGIPKSNVIRAQNKLRDGGSEAFFIDHRGRHGNGKVFKPEILESEKAQSLLDSGLSRSDTARELGVKYALCARQ